MLQEQRQNIAGLAENGMLGLALEDISPRKATVLTMLLLSS
jgi:hypothetical protein